MKNHCTNKWGRLSTRDFAAPLDGIMNIFTAPALKGPICMCLRHKHTQALAYNHTGSYCIAICSPENSNHA